MSKFFSFILGIGFSLVCLCVLANVPTFQDKFIDYVNNQRQEIEVEVEDDNSDGVENLSSEDDGEGNIGNLEDNLVPAAFIITRG